MSKNVNDDLVNRVGRLAKAAQGLTRVAVQQYSAEVGAILKAQNVDPREIERCLDGMLDFCFDQEMLLLYKKLCRYYFDIDPEATAAYVHTYREMWDEKTRLTGRATLDKEGTMSFKAGAGGPRVKSHGDPEWPSRSRGRQIRRERKFAPLNCSWQLEMEKGLDLGASKLLGWMRMNDI